MRRRRRIRLDDGYKPLRELKGDHKEHRPESPQKKFKVGSEIAQMQIEQIRRGEHEGF